MRHWRKPVPGIIMALYCGFQNYNYFKEKRLQQNITAYAIYSFCVVNEWSEWPTDINHVIHVRHCMLLWFYFNVLEGYGISNLIHIKNTHNGVFTEISVMHLLARSGWVNIDGLMKAFFCLLENHNIIDVLIKKDKPCKYFQHVSQFNQFNPKSG